MCILISYIFCFFSSVLYVQNSMQPFLCPTLLCKFCNIFKLGIRVEGAAVRKSLGHMWRIWTNSFAPNVACCGPWTRILVRKKLKPESKVHKTYITHCLPRWGGRDCSSGGGWWRRGRMGLIRCDSSCIVRPGVGRLCWALFLAAYLKS